MKKKQKTKAQLEKEVKRLKRKVKALEGKLEDLMPIPVTFKEEDWNKSKAVLVPNGNILFC